MRNSVISQRIVAAWWCIFLFFCTGSLWADMVYLKDGRVLVGRIEGQNATSLTLVTEEGRQQLQKGSIVRIQYGDVEKQLEERRQRLAREAEIKRQQAESQRLAIERQKAQEEAKRLALEKEKADQLAKEAKEADAKRKAEEERDRLQQEQQQALEEARKLEESKSAIDVSTELLKEQNEIATSVLSVRSGWFRKQSAVAKTGAQLPYIGDPNRIVQGGFTVSAVSDLAELSLPFGSFNELQYESHRHNGKTGWLHRIGGMDVSASPYSVIRQENLAGIVFDGTSNQSYQTHIDSFDFFQKPRFREFSYDLLFKVYPFSKDYFENLYFIFGGAIVATDLQSKTGSFFENRSGALDPHSISPFFVPNGSRNGDLKNHYTAGLGYLQLGIGYLFPFYDIHSVDVRVVGAAGTGASYLDYEASSWIDVDGAPIVAKSSVRGNANLKARRIDAELGYSIVLYRVKLRVFGRLQKEHVSVSSVSIRSDNKTDKTNAAITLASGGQPDLSAYLLEKMKNAGPYPEAGGWLRGIGIEVGYTF